MEKVASIIRYKGRDNAVMWIYSLPKRYTAYEAKTILDEVREGNFLLWTEDGGIKIL